MISGDLRFFDDGAERHVGAASEIVEQLAALVDQVPESPGTRLTGIPGFGEILSRGPLATIAKTHLGRTGAPVRAVFFDKSISNNWTLNWHQDRTIAVKRQRDADGFGPWTTKQGQLHVAPPIKVIEQMVTLRVHFDVVNDDNAPLLIALGTHRLGFIPESDVAESVSRATVASCHAERGDVWAYATPILHRSAPSTSVRRRRVLQVDYASQRLPNGLEWAGV